MEGFPEYFNDENNYIDFTYNPINEILNLFESEHRIKAVELINEEMPINPETMEVSYTILEEICDQLKEYPTPRNEIKFKHYTLVD